MDAKKIGVVCMTAVLATEVIKKHEEGSLHTHVEFEQAIHSRMTLSIYGIPHQQFNNGKTVIGFPTMGIPFFLKID
jgi:hypothetical protein